MAVKNIHSHYLQDNTLCLLDHQRHGRAPEQGLYLGVDVVRATTRTRRTGAQRTYFRATWPLSSGDFPHS